MRLPLSLPPFVTSLRLRFTRRTRPDLWFPQIPLALAVGIAGLIALLPTIRRYLQEYLHLQLTGLFDALHPISANVPELILRGVPSTVIGVLQILIAIGLLLRSRLAWVSAVLITLAQLVLAIGYSHARWFSPPVLYIAALLAALAISGQAFRRSSLAAGTLFALAASVLLLTYGCSAR